MVDVDTFLTAVNRLQDGCGRRLGRPDPSIHRGRSAFEVTCRPTLAPSRYRPGAEECDLIGA
jgi:hypothetical protein